AGTGGVGRPAALVEPDVVADDRSERVVLGRAADGAEQRDVVDPPSLRLVDAGLLGEDQRDGADPEPALERLPHREVGREGERSDDLCARDAHSSRAYAAGG